MVGPSERPVIGLTPGTVVDGRWVVESVLGRGGLAVVYCVRHVQLGSLHALKVLTVNSHDERQRFLQEARLQATLRHENIVTVTDFTEVDGAPAFVMELVEESLNRRLAAGPLSLAECDAIAVGILTGVGAAHAVGLVHRDLKPGNILLARSGNRIVPKVADFGLATLRSGGAGLDVTRSGITIGTPPYMAPEQISNVRGVDKRADIFSLGAILYELTCGVRAFPDKDALRVFNAIVAGRYIPPRTHVPSLPDRAVRAIEGALVVELDERIPDCETLLAIWSGGERATASDPHQTAPIEHAPSSDVRPVQVVPEPTLSALRPGTQTRPVPVWVGVGAFGAFGLLGVGVLLVGGLMLLHFGGPNEPPVVDTPPEAPAPAVAALPEPPKVTTDVAVTPRSTNDAVKAPSAPSTPSVRPATPVRPVATASVEPDPWSIPPPPPGVADAPNPTPPPPPVALPSMVSVHVRACSADEVAISVDGGPSRVSGPPRQRGADGTRASPSPMALRVADLRERRRGDAGDRGPLSRVHHRPELRELQ